MKHAYFKELRRYTRDEIANLLEIDLIKVQEIIDRLRLQNIIKLDKQDSKKYYFDYVGIIVYNYYVIKCYPKYVEEYNKDNCFKNIVKVIKKYGRNETTIESMNEEFQHLEFNLISVILFILYDYIENGLYSEHKEVNVINGDGDIDWDKTINDTYAMMSNNKPLYLNVYTRSLIDNEHDYFKQLHMHIINTCSLIIRKAKLDTLFSIPYFELEVQEERFIDNEETLNKIERELQVQFITRKQNLLRIMHTFIAKRDTSSNNLGLSMYGTKNFELIWESVCKSVLDDKLNHEMRDLNINLKKDFKKAKEKKLIELIDKPLWIPELSKEKVHKAKRTLTPDIISIYKSDFKKHFIIFDAKYYNIALSTEGVRGNPGVESVTKQYLYNLAFEEFIEVHSFDVFKNIFIFPSDKESVEFLGNVKMEILEKLKLKSIMVIKVPADYFYKMYLDGKKLDIEKYFSLNLDAWKKDKYINIKVD